MQISTLRSGADAGLQVVEYERLGAGTGVVGEHHVRLLQWSARGFERSLNVDQAHLADRDAEYAQRIILGDREILAVATPLADRLERRGPVIALLPNTDVVIKNDVPVEKVIDALELGIVI